MLIDLLRRKYGAELHPLSELILSFDGMKVTLEYIFEDKLQKAFFRVHPDDDGLFFWFDEKEGKRYILAQQLLLKNYNDKKAKWRRSVEEAKKVISDLEPKIGKVQSQMEEYEKRVDDVAELAMMKAVDQLDAMMSQLADAQKQLAEPEPQKPEYSDVIQRFFSQGLYVALNDIVSVCIQHRDYLKNYLGGVLPKPPKKAVTTLRRGAPPIGMGLMDSLEIVGDREPLRLNIEFVGEGSKQQK